MEKNEVKKTVREAYSKIAVSGGGCGCLPVAPGQKAGLCRLTEGRYQGNGHLRGPECLGASRSV